MGSLVHKFLKQLFAAATRPEIEKTCLRPLQCADVDVRQQGADQAETCCLVYHISWRDSLLYEALLPPLGLEARS